MKKATYYNILTSETSTEATILMYDYIGEYVDWDIEKGWHKAGITDIDFVQELERLAAKYPVIHIRINSPGGEVFHGSAIVTAIVNCTAEVHTWIDGVAASMAGIIWMSGHKRHMARNAMLMLHCGSNIVWGNKKDMRKMADTLEIFDESLAISAASAVGMSEEDMKTKYFDGEDHWLNYNAVSAEGWLSPDKEEYDAAAKLPDNITALAHRDLVAWFEKSERPAAAAEPLQSYPVTLLQKFRALFGGGSSDVPNPSPTPATNADDQSRIEMNFEEFKKALEDGSLDRAAVTAHLAATQAQPQAAPEQPAANPEITALKAEMETLKATLLAFGQSPAAGKSLPGAPGQDLPTDDGRLTAQARLKSANEEYNKAADRDEPLKVSIG